MLFEQLPTGVLAVLMGISCAVKHTAIIRLVYTKWYQQVMRSRHWYLAVLVMSVAAGGGTYLIVHKFVGCPWSVYLAVVDTVLHVVAGFYAQRIKLFDLDRRQHVMMVILFRTLFGLAYVAYIWLALGSG